MRKILIALAVGLLLIAGCKQEARAELSIPDLISKLPTSDVGLFYNITDSEFEFTSTFKALSYKGINLNIGYATPNVAVASLGYEIIRLEKLGIELPILKDIIIDAGWTVGLGKLFNHQEFVQGPNVTLKLKF